MPIFLTNDFDLSAQQIALLYKQRWQIELGLAENIYSY